MAAAAFLPELALSEGDAQELSKAIAGVNQFYSTTIDPKVLAWVGVLTVAGKIYAPRFIAAGLRKRMERPKPMTVKQPVVSTPQSAPKPAPVVNRQMEQVFSDPTFVAPISNE